MLTQKRLKELLHYCPETGVFVWVVKPRKNMELGDVAGSVNGCGYVQIQIDGKLYLAHRLAWLFVNGKLPPSLIDHINRQRADNRICNLRIATTTENLQNASIRTDNTSGQSGVSWHKVTKKWRARIQTGKKEIYIGLFNDISDAISARKAAEPIFHKFQNTKS